ncbi:MAG: TerB family tellurite resistance protein [Bacteriovoracaceae bacterium]|nr:TerB family tellurite resistance protein [Bacteriovoracaceae bacterium]
MSFLHFWNKSQTKNDKNCKLSGLDSEKLSRLHQKISKILPNQSDAELVKVACLAGLLARMAYVDLKIHDSEKKALVTALENWTSLSKEKINTIAELAIEEVLDLVGMENYKYCHPLNEVLNNDEKYAVLVSLFTMAASDGSVDNIESEEIRVITEGLRLEHKHYISARATVLSKLKALNL